MEYTLEQKAVAVLENRLWWRFPNSSNANNNAWTRVRDDASVVDTPTVSMGDAEYFIGDAPPPILTALEQELLEALQAMLNMHEEGATLVGLVAPVLESARAAIAKATGKQE